MKIKKSYVILSLLIFTISFSITGRKYQTFRTQYNFATPKLSVGEISIITPENKTYTQPDNGYYPGSIGFEDDLIGTIPDDWWYRVPDGGSFYRVVDEWQGRKNVYEIRKNGGSIKIETNVNFSTPATIGSVDFWLYKDTGSGIDPSRINLEDGYETDYFTFGFEAETFYTGPWEDKQQIFPNAFSEDEWHYVRVDFNMSKGWQVQIDDTLYGAGYAFTTYVGNPTQVMNFQLESIWSGDYPNYGAWLDSIGYSWDPNYNIGDNSDEGLLLSFNSNIDLDWQGYSLDGQANKTILGNTTIPMPSDGLHSIQVFGNDTMGSMYESDIQYFTTNVLGPSISVNSPLSNVLSGVIAPSFTLTIPDADLDTTWYSLDGGTTTIPFTGLSGSIDQTEWNKIGNGTATITFYANDTANNIAQASVTVRKDIIVPLISINDPSSTEEFEFTPIYDITVDEANLDEVWYTIDGGAHNYTITEFLGTINSEAWAYAPSGPVTIRFYARDLAGNVGTAYLIVVKTSTQQQPPPAIPGYNLFLVVGVISLISIMILRKRPKS